MRVSKKTHYNVERKIQQLIPLLLKREALVIARVCDDLTFDELKRLAKIIAFFSKGQ